MKKLNAFSRKMILAGTLGFLALVAVILIPGSSPVDAQSRGQSCVRNRTDRRNWSKQTYRIWSNGRILNATITNVGTSTIGGGRSCGDGPSELADVNRELSASCSNQHGCNYDLDATRLSYCSDCPSRLVFSYKCSAAGPVRTKEVPVDTGWRQPIMLGTDCEDSVRCALHSGARSVNDRPSQWSVWSGTANRTPVSFDLSLGNRDSTGYIGEAIEGNRGGHLDNIRYYQHTGKIYFRRLGRDWTQWYSGCLKWDPAPNPGASPPVAGVAKMIGKFSHQTGVAMGEPALTAFTNDFNTTATFGPASAPIDVAPMTPIGAETYPVPVSTYRIQVCSNPPPGTQAAIAEEEVYISPALGDWQAMMEPRTRCFAASDPNTCLINLTSPEMFLHYWGEYVWHGSEYPACDQVLFQVFNCRDAETKSRISSTRVARIDLRVPLPYTARLSCGSDYVIPPGVDHQSVVAADFTGARPRAFEPLRRAFLEKAGQINRSIVIAGARIETDVSKAENYRVSQSFPTTLRDLRERYLNLAYRQRTDSFGVTEQNTLARMTPNLGAIIPIGLVIARINKLSELGRLPSAEKKEMKSIETFDCPADPAAAGKCVFPVHQYQALLPEIARFFRKIMVRYLFDGCARKNECDKVFRSDQNPTAPPLSGEKDPDINQQLARNSYDPAGRLEGMQSYYMLGGKHISNFACKLLSKYLPGMTKVEKIKIVPKGINVMGDWEDPITDKAALAKELGKPQGSGSASPIVPYEPPPREEVIEVCTVTHSHLDLQLKNDLGFLAYILRAEWARTLDESPDAWMGVADDDNDPFNLERRQLDLSTERTPSDANTPLDSHAKLQNDQRLNNETYQTIADRLMGFYRKGGKARVFSETHGGMKGTTTIQIPMDKFPPQMDDAGATNLNNTMPQQNDREDLRRQVDQWSDAWEYNRMREFIRRKVPDANYDNREKQLVAGLWTDCADIWEVCKNPKFLSERQACVRCAYEGITTYCINGTADPKAQRCGAKEMAARPGEVRKLVIPDANCPQGKCEVKHFLVDNLWWWLRFRLADEAAAARFYSQAVRSDADKLYSWVAPAVGLQWFFPYNKEVTTPASEQEVADYILSSLPNIVAPQCIPSIVTRMNRYRSSFEKKSTISGAGRRYLLQAPLTPWQRCYLWTGKIEFSRVEIDSNCGLGATSLDSIPSQATDWDDFQRRVWPFWRDILDSVRGQNWSQKPLFLAARNATLPDPSAGVGADLRNADKTRFEPVSGCSDHITADDPNVGDGNAAGAATHFLAYRLSPPAPPGASEQPGGEDTGGAMVDALGPIIGKIISMLIKGDIEQVMKVLAKAAGMTPEQAIDCEDAEYRHETMKLGCPGKDNSYCPGQPTVKCCQLDNKRGCLTKVFAKNFVDMLESIITMLGNKLVDWAVDAIRGALEAVKIALVTAAGSIPFVGGVMAAIVEVAWELLMNFGAKALLKGLVVQNLPKWLKIRELVGENLDKLIEKHPIISLVAGIILDLITQALAMGDKGLVEVGFASALNFVQGFLEKNAAQNAFWIRAIIFAKKELVHQKGSEDFKEQAKAVLSAIITGFFKAIEQRVDDSARKKIGTALENIKKFIATFDIATFGQQLMSGNPIDYIMKEILGKMILPIAIPIITAFTDIPPWVKKILNAGSDILDAAVGAIAGGPGLTLDQIKGIMRVVSDEVKTEVIEKLPLGNDDLMEVAKTVYEWVVGFFLTPDDQKNTTQLDNPLEMLKSLLGHFKGFAIDQVMKLVSDESLRPEQSLLSDAMNTLFDLVTDVDAQKRAFGTSDGSLPANATDMLKKVVEIGGGYAQARLRKVVEGTGLETAVDLGLSALLNPNDGLLTKGQVGINGIGAWFSAAGNGRNVVGRIVDALWAFFETRIREAPMSPVLRSLANGILTTIGVIIKSENGFSDVVRDKAGGVIARIQDSLRPVINVVVDAIGATTPPGESDFTAGMVKGHARTVLNGVLSLFDRASDLKGPAANANATELQNFSSRISNHWNFISSDRAFQEGVRALVRLSVGNVQAVLNSVSFEPQSVAAVVVQTITRAAGDSEVVRILSTVVRDAIGLFTPPFDATKFRTSFDATASAFFQQLVGTSGSPGPIRLLLKALSNAFVRDTQMRQIADTAVDQVITFIQAVLTDINTIGTAARTALGGVVDVFLSFLRGKLISSIPPNAAALRTFATNAFDQLGNVARQAAGLTVPSDARTFNWNALSTSKDILAIAAGAIFDIAIDILLNEMKSDVGKVFVSGFAGFVRMAIVDFPTFKTKFGQAANNKGWFWSMIVDGNDKCEATDDSFKGIVCPFFRKTLVEPFSGPAQKAMNFLVGQAMKVLKDPAGFRTWITNIAQKENSTSLAKEIARGLVNDLANGIRSSTLCKIVKVAAELMVTPNQVPDLDALAQGCGVR